jgi:hypothetical protein
MNTTSASRFSLSQPDIAYSWDRAATSQNAIANEESCPGFAASPLESSIAPSQPTYTIAAAAASVPSRILT